MAVTVVPAWLRQQHSKKPLYIKIAAGVLALVVILLIVSTTYPTGDDDMKYIHSPSIPSFLGREVARQEFVHHALQHDVSDPFDIGIISKLCRNRPARNDVIVQCAPGTGGVGNIRSYMLHCTRFAMEAGASILLPNFHGRLRSDLFELNGAVRDFEYFFDRKHYIETVQKACPHLTVHENVQQEWSIANMEIPHWPYAINESHLENPSPWRKQFDQWFKEATAELKNPVLVVSGDPGRDRFVMDDGMDFYFTFGRILQFRPDARRLAALCIAELSRKFKLGLDPKQNMFTNAYMGAHLRTSNDAVKAGWNPDFEEQTDWYITQALDHNLTIIYAAGGNDEDLKKFAEKGLDMGLHVVNKYDLVSGNDLRELDNFLWDQRGLVDFEILLKATQYGGYARSSFSHNIAFRRRAMSNVTDPFADALNHYQDELSVVYGRFDANWEDEGVRTMWP